MISQNKRGERGIQNLHTQGHLRRRNRGKSARPPGREQRSQAPRQSTPRAAGGRFLLDVRGRGQGGAIPAPMLEDWTGISPGTCISCYSLLSRHDGYVMKMYALASKGQPAAGREDTRRDTHPSKGSDWFTRFVPASEAPPARILPQGGLARTPDAWRQAPRRRIRCRCLALRLAG